MVENDVMRALRFLATGPVAATPGAGGAKLLLDGGERGAISVAKEAVQHVLSEGLARCCGSELSISPEGTARLRRIAGGADGFRAQHRTLERQHVETPAGFEAVAINLEESPLAALARRRDRGGRPLLSAAQLAAGERLRADFTRGQLMPRLGANWQASVASGHRDAGRGGIADLTDAALGARIRVEHALDAVGPELAGVLIDVCCFLKGMETVEAERRWPARSAKLLLSAALDALARHYNPARPSRRGVLHWGADGFRPQQGGGDAV
jgi:hypothetical protein